MSLINFLGVYDKTSQNEFAKYEDSGKSIYFTNIIGLSHVTFQPVFPVTITNFCFTVNVQEVYRKELEELRVDVYDEKDIRIYTILIENKDTNGFYNEQKDIKKNDKFGLNKLELVFVEDVSIYIDMPGTYHFYFILGNYKVHIGLLIVAWQGKYELTEDRIKAIKAYPKEYRSIGVSMLKDTLSRSLLKVYCAIDRDRDMEKDGWIWYLDLPKSMVIQNEVISMKYLKEGMPNYLRKNSSVNMQEKLVFNHIKLVKIYREFKNLLDNINNNELVFQEFLSNNTVFLIF